MEQNDKRWWISTSKFNWFKGLFINSNSSKDGNWDELIYFDSEDDATQFYAKLLGFILKEYPRAEKESWYKDLTVQARKIESIKYE